MLSSVLFTSVMSPRGVAHPDSKEALAERVKLIREVKGWTQAFAARMVGESQVTWAYWESANNQRVPTSRQLIQLEIVTGFPREWIQSGIAERMSPRLLESLSGALARQGGGKAPRKRKN